MLVDDKDPLLDLDDDTKAEKEAEAEMLKLPEEEIDTLDEGVGKSDNDGVPRDFDNDAEAYEDALFEWDEDDVIVADCESVGSKERVGVSRNVLDGNVSEELCDNEGVAVELADSVGDGDGVGNKVFEELPVGLVRDLVDDGEGEAVSLVDSERDVEELGDNVSEWLWLPDGVGTRVLEPDSVPTVTEGEADGVCESENDIEADTERVGVGGGVTVDEPLVDGLPLSLRDREGVNECDPEICPVELLRM